jgi:NADH:ubiquinone oxidoreductase subunit 5 (subunit L)/multisubunit Na+/H+ antiporter MnhA subunit
MIKSTATLIGFIIALSIIYYISYWGSFDINVFQYLAATDIIKGVAYPLRFGVLLGAVFSLYVLIVTIQALFKKSKELKKEDAKVEEKKGRVIANSIFLVISALVFAYFRDRVLAGAVLSIFSLFLVINIITFVNAIFDAAGLGLNKEEVSPFKKSFLIDIISLFEMPLIVLLLVNALISGQVEANAIKSGISFDYIATRDLPPNTLKTNEKYLIFLGSAGDKYFFIDKVSNEHFVVDKAVLQVVKSFHFERGSKDAQAVFERNIQ